MTHAPSPCPHQAAAGAHHGHHTHAADDQAQILDLDAHVLADHLAGLTRWLPLQAPPARILDLGCGTGAGTFALLDQFPEARVTAVDTSAAHLGRLAEKARERGLADRVRTVEADLDADKRPGLGTPDLVWASASLHHMAHPDRALRQVHDLLAPGGLLAVVELSGFPRFLPASGPGEPPSLEERCHEVSAGFHATHMPHRGADWGPMLTGAGFTVEGERTLTVRIDGSRDAAIGAYARSGLERLRLSVADSLPPEDLAALDRLLDAEGPESILRRDDLAVRTERQVWAARRTA
ncbi:class I SAM-dependent methyltransferase [Streptomyces albidoflavus]|uniref:class I SAM-dependent methyltransferase n=1 Tax=Streptomyces albidoflavus TaxID=1886 RepID=UPI0033A4D67E